MNDIPQYHTSEKWPFGALLARFGQISVAKTPMKSMVFFSSVGYLVTVCSRELVQKDPWGALHCRAGAENQAKNPMKSTPAVWQCNSEILFYSLITPMYDLKMKN